MDIYDNHYYACKISVKHFVNSSDLEVIFPAGYYLHCWKHNRGKFVVIVCLIYAVLVTTIK